MQRPLRACSKLIGQHKVATLASGEPNETWHDYTGVTLPKLSPSRLLYVSDKRNKCNDLIDTGQLSVFYLGFALTGPRTQIVYI